jgi:hypothetical protein
MGVVIGGKFRGTEIGAGGRAGVEGMQKDVRKRGMSRHCVRCLSMPGEIITWSLGLVRL